MATSGDIPKRIVVPLDGSDSSFEAAKYAIRLAKMSGAEIIFMHALANPPYIDARSAGMMLPTYIDETRRHAETWYMNVEISLRRLASSSLLKPYLMWFHPPIRLSITPQRKKPT